MTTTTDTHMTLRARPGLARAARILATGRRPEEPAKVRQLRAQLADAHEQIRLLEMRLAYHRDREVARETRESHGQWTPPTGGAILIDVPAPGRGHSA
jgi:hypothetical protein